MTTLEAIATVVDCEHKTAPITPGGGHFAVGTPAMRGNTINYAEAREIDADTFLDWTRRLAPAPGDLLFAREAPVGPVVRVPTAPLVAPGQRTVLLRIDPDLADAEFVYYLLASPDLQRYIATLAAGSTVAHLNVADVRSLELGPLPKIHIQRAIAEVLGALDDKIAANRSAVAKYASLIPALFRAAVERSTERSEVPLDRLATFTKGVSYRSEDVDVEADSYLVGLKTVGRRGGFQRRGLRAYAGLARPDQQIHPGEIVVAQTDLTQNAEVVGRAIRVPRMPKGRRAVASLDLAIARPADDVEQLFLLGVLSQPSFQSHCRSHVTGTTVLHLARAAMPTYIAPVLPGWEQKLYAEKVAPMYAASDALFEESELLGQTRDELLPLLMSGKITVKDAEKTVEGVV